MKYTDIVWDFNGTIIDDVEAGILSVNKMLSDRGIQTIPNKERYQELFCFPIIEYYRNCGFDFDREPYEVLAPIWVEQYLIHSVNSPLQDGVNEALCLFEELGQAMSFSDEVYKHILPIDNRPEIFGNQIVTDAEDEQIIKFM